MNELAKAENQVPATAADMDPYAAYGQAVAADATPFLKFIKGKFQFGQDGEPLPLGTKLVPHMGELKIGFIKWQNGKPINEITVRIADSEPVPQREDLDAKDASAWEMDSNGVAIDPWGKINTLPFKNPETGEQYVYTTGSRGGIDAIGKLSTAYGSHRQKHDGKMPIVQIGAGSYQHKTHGEVFYPVFRIVSWASEADLIAGKSDAKAEDELDDEIPW